MAALGAYRHRDAANSPTKSPRNSPADEPAGQASADSEAEAAAVSTSSLTSWVSVVPPSSASLSETLAASSFLTSTPRAACPLVSAAERRSRFFGVETQTLVADATDDAAEDGESDQPALMSAARLGSTRRQPDGLE